MGLQNGEWGINKEMIKKVFNYMKQRRSENEKKKLIKLELQKQEEQRKQETNYLHLNLGKVEYFDQLNGVIISGLLTITDDDENLHQIDFSGYKETLHYKENGIFTVNRDEELTFIIENDEIVTHFQLNNYQYTLLQSFYDKVNVNVINRQEEFKNELDVISKEIIKDEETYNMFRNFLRKSNQRIFYDDDYILTFERLILVSGRIGAKTLMFRDNQGELVPRILEEMKLFYENQWIPLYQVLLIKEKLPWREADEIDKAFFFMWSLIRSIAFDDFAEEFKEKQGIYFSGLKDMPLDKYIYRYIEIEEFDATSLRNMSLFTCYLMKRKKLADNNFFIIRNEITQHVDAADRKS